MFERYTEKARRVIFFGRYEASQFGSRHIETEHLLLGLLREDKPLAIRFLRSEGAVESIRDQIEGHCTPSEMTSTSVDLPLSHESKRVLAYGAEESERLNHKPIDTAHLFLGLLREEKSFAARMLQERGLRLDQVREEVMRSNLDFTTEVSTSRRPEFPIELLHEWAEAGGVTVAARPTVGGHTPDFAIYSGHAEDTDGEVLSGAATQTPSTEPETISQLQRRIKAVVQRMEDAIASHQFERARLWSEEHRELRLRLRQKRDQLGPEADASVKPPLLCIEILRDERLADLQRRVDDYLASGVSQVWAFDLSSKRAYTITAAEGLRQFKGEVLRIADPLLELDLKRAFA